MYRIRLGTCALLAGIICFELLGTLWAADPPSPGDGSQAVTESAAVDPLLEQVDEAIDAGVRRYLSAEQHTPWQIVHGVLALRHGYQIKQNGEKVNAIEWISNNAVYRGEHWFEKTPHGGRAHPFSKAYAFEGHPNQFLGYMTMSNLPLNHQLKVADGTITIADIVKHAKANVVSNEEITWTLWALVHYLGPDAKWENKYGEEWSIEKLVQIQTREPVYRAACGGTHGLFALSYARNAYLSSGRKLTGVWLEADQKIQRYIAEAKAYQNRDGSFSSSFFQGSKYASDFQQRLGPSGHTLEFLMVALPAKRLGEQWVRNGVASVARDLIENRTSPAECGALYHGLDGLVIYRDRMQPKPPITTAAQSSDNQSAQNGDNAADGSASKSGTSVADDAPVEAPMPVAKSQTEPPKPSPPASVEVPSTVENGAGAAK